MRRPARILLYLGTAAIVLGIAQLHAAQNGYALLDSFRFRWTLVYIVVLSVAAYAAGLPDLTRTARGALVAGLPVAGFGALAVSVLQLIMGAALLPRFVLVASGVLFLPWCVAMTAVASTRRFGVDRRDHVLFIGDSRDGAILAADLATGAERPADVVHCVSAAEVEDLDASGETLLRVVKGTRANVIVLSREAQASNRIIHQVARLHEAGFRVRTLSLFYEQWLGKLPVSELERVSLLFDIGELHRLLYLRLARLLDLAVSTAGIVVLATVVPVVIAGNLVANRGSLFYRQLRVGKNHVPFLILKFRTMTGSANDRPNEWTTEDDPRITPFGRILRRTHLDELPQVLNILRGELSVVGPRPEQPHYVDALVEKLPFYDLRHLVRPGLTGWAQVKYGYAGNEVDALEKLQYEFYYLRRQGLLFDLRIIGRTLRSVIGGEGR